MTEKEILYNKVLDAQKALSEARKNYDVYEKEDKRKQQEALEKEWYNNYIVPLLNCEGKFYTGCNGRKYVYIDHIIDLDKYKHTLKYGCDFFKIENTPEFVGIEIYYAEKAYDNWSFGRWDIDNGGTIHIPDFNTHLLTEITKEEFIEHFNKCVEGVNKCKNYFNNIIING